MRGILVFSRNLLFQEIFKETHENQRFTTFYAKNDFPMHGVQIQLILALYSKLFEGAAFSQKSQTSAEFPGFMETAVSVAELVLTRNCVLG